MSTPLRWLYAIGLLTLMGSGIATLLAWFGSYHWMLDLLAHFRLQYAWLLSAVLLGAVIAKRLPMIMWTTLFLSLNLSVIWPLYWGTQAPQDPERGQLSVVVFNVNYHNPNPAELASYLADADADIVLILEAVSPVEEAVSTALVGYEKFGHTSSDAFGMLLYSRLPMVEAEELYFGDSALLAIAARVVKGQESFSILGLHTMPPVGAAESALRDTMLQRAKNWAANEEHPIIIGDFNATPWSHSFATLIEGDLHNSQIGFGAQTSWPNQLWPLAIPIDHGVIGKSLTTVKRSLGPFLGSDHRPLSLTFGFARGHQ